MAYLFKIQIEGLTKPPVWRKVLVPENYTFKKLHEVIQAAFGWEESHVYEFSPSGWGSSPTIGSQFEKYFGDGPEQDSAKVKLKDVFTTEKQTFVYIYDFGDDWRHKITLEKISAELLKKPSCVDGKGACPPEDCGGVWGYLDFLEAINNPNHPEHSDMMEWAGLDDGQTWEDEDGFDVAATNEMVEKVK